MMLPYVWIFLHVTNNLPHALRIFFSFANANFHDNIIIVFAHAIDLDVSMAINN